ncbi:hypothetical protein SAY87_011157 [Trapa incisa]|uniref:Uncharacterized protein n=1 Tax=Trapa incisa TaxID=236973 RepID=A0AAN7GF66_9MYRT|nr:hypothetical protein SAY87_011157 [Trapa incisa]
MKITICLVAWLLAVAELDEAKLQRIWPLLPSKSTISTADVAEVLRLGMCESEWWGWGVRDQIINHLSSVHIPIYYLPEKYGRSCILVLVTPSSYLSLAPHLLYL